MIPVGTKALVTGLMFEAVGLSSLVLYEEKMNVAYH